MLKNANIEFTISGGRITSFYDVKLERELIPEGKTGGLVIFTDRYVELWNLDIGLFLNQHSALGQHIGTLGIPRFVTDGVAVRDISLIQCLQVYDIRSGKPLEFASIKIVENGPVFA